MDVFLQVGLVVIIEIVEQLTVMCLFDGCVPGITEGIPTGEHIMYNCNAYESAIQLASSWYLCHLTDDDVGFH